MSHFTVMVISPDGTVEESEQLLAPFSEHLEVPPYEKPCWCIGLVAKADAHNLAEKEMPIEPARTEFVKRQEIKALIDESKLAGNYGFSPKVDALWKAEFEDEFERRIVEFMALDPRAEQADPECQECNGAGIETTTYNPKSKWDWYLVGGRWVEQFELFQGKLVSEFVGAKDEDGSPLRTFAILTPDGDWIERGEMGWFAVVTDEKSPNEWEACYTATLEKYKDCRMIVFDCHI